MRCRRIAATARRTHIQRMKQDRDTGTTASKPKESGENPPAKPPVPERVPEVGGRKGPEPTRYGDWEKDGRCVDF